MVTTQQTIRSVVAYLRVSTEEQTLGIEAQREQVTAYCAARGWTLQAVIVDAGAGGDSLQREGMTKLRTVMKRRMVDAVITWKFDRLTREPSDMDTLLHESEVTGVGIVSISENFDTSTAAGRFMLRMIVSTARYELDSIRERTRMALQVKARRGERVGRHAAIGAANGEGARVEEEQQALQELRTIILSGTCDCEGMTSVRCLAEQLEALGHLNRAGNRYAPSTIHRMIKSLARTDAEMAARLGQDRSVRRQEMQVSRHDELLALVGSGIAA